MKTIKSFFFLFGLIFIMSCSSDSENENSATPTNDRTCQFTIGFISSDYRIDMKIPNSFGGLDEETLFRDNTIPQSNTIFVHKEYENVNDQIFEFRFLNASGETNYFSMSYKVMFNYLIDGFSGNQGNTDLSIPANQTLIIRIDPTKKHSLETSIE